MQLAPFLSTLNKQINDVKEGFYKIENIILRQYKAQKYILGEKDVTVFVPITEHFPSVTSEMTRRIT